MIISPPFLPTRGTTQVEDAWLDLAMSQPPSRLPGTEALEGSFPLSYNLAWHNGMHLQAPQAAGANLPVRAIADGEVILVREPTTPNASVDDGQNYNPFDRPGVKTAAWTDNGCVIVRHKTEIGANGTAPTELVCYSLYMHLSEVAKITPAPGQARRPLKAGDAIWRKDEIGKPGQIYGHAGQIHFEISLDAANLQKLIGRAPNWVEPATAPATLPAPTADGRIDSIFGSLYFYLPANTPTDTGTSLPTNHLRRAGGTTLGAAIWVRMTYEQGGCTFETYDERGGKLGAMPTEADVEYDLYKLAHARHDSLSGAEQAHSSPSGWYELLRFGRNIGRGAAAADKDPLPANAAHWRRIAGASGQPVWADLNASGSFKFSDADFLAVMGWNCISDDTTPNDQRCDSINIKALIRDPDPANSKRMAVEELVRRLGKPEVQKKLRRAICKFPSEWDKATTQARYGFVQELESFKQAPEAWPRLLKHLEAISFDNLPQEFKDADWHMHPREFVGAMRECGWLNAKELAQCIPRNAIEQTRNSAGSTTYPQSEIGWSVALSRATTYVIDLNVSFRKYGISSKLRMAYFLANSIQETIYFSRKSELGGSGTRYAPWYGRGFLQLTWEGNYRNYGDFRGWGAQPASTFRDSLELNNSRAIDSAGYYWITCAKVRSSAVCISRYADQVPNLQHANLANVCTNYSYKSKSCAGRTVSIDYYSAPQSEQVARAINTGNANSTGVVNGLIPRNNVLANALNVLVELEYLNSTPQRP